MQNSATPWPRLVARLLAVGGLLMSSQLAACVGIGGLGGGDVQYQGGSGPSIGGNYNPALGGPTRGGGGSSGS